MHAHVVLLCPCKSAMFLSQNFDGFFYKIFGGQVG